MKNNLTAEQRQAVENRGGNLLVSAAAGSGKTKVLVDRLMMYLTDTDSPCNIDDFLIITYTKAAASELRAKIASKISEYLAEDPNNMGLRKQMQRIYLAQISTVHSFCTELLRDYAFNLDIPSDFRVADENECTQLQVVAMEETLDEAYANRHNDPDFLAFVNSQGLGRDDRLVPEIILKVYNSARCHLNPKAWLDYCVESANISQCEDAGNTVWGAYLMKDLHTYLETQIKAMKECLRLASQDTALEKVSALLKDTIFDLELLRKAKTWDEVIQRKSIKYGTMRFPKKMENPDLAGKIKAVRDNCKKGLEKRLKVFADPSALVMEDLGQTSGAVRGLVKLTASFADKYQKQKNRRRVLDFTDLEQRTLDLLLGKGRTGPTKLAKEVGKRYREVLVDEYQDTNAVQDAIFMALTSERNNCFMVGDVKQSIYQFRLADPGIFLEKYHKYQPAETVQDGSGRKVLLSKNFRSGGAVLEATNDVFCRCMDQTVGGLDYGEAESLKEGIPHVSLGEPEVELHVLCTSEDTYAEEATFVAERIQQMLDGTHMIRDGETLRPIVPDDVVILLRSPGSVGKVFQDALSAKGIRSSFGNGVNLLETEEIGVIHSLLKIVSNPRQDIPLISVLASPAFGFSADDLARIRTLRRNCNFYDALLLDENPKSVSFREQLERFRDAARKTTLAGLLEEIICATRLDSIYAAMPDGAEKTSNLREFFRFVMNFESSGRKDLTQFLEHLDLLKEKGLNTGDTPTRGAVSILSIHKSKGLEYPVVFLSALARGFNRESLRAQVLCDKELGLGLSAVDHQNRVRYPTIAKRAIVARTTRDSISEELRVLYVAMTRARDRLIMTYASKSPGKTLGQIANSLDIGGSHLLSQDVSSLGEWVLIEAMCRTEAGALFQLANAKPAETHISDYPWRIEVHGDIVAVKGKESTGKVGRENLPEGVAEQLSEYLAFQYEHTSATVVPSKQTATQQNEKETAVPVVSETEKAQEDDEVVPVYSWRRMQEKKTASSGKEYGIAMHTIMQYIHFDRCDTLAGIQQEIQWLVTRGVLTEEQASKADVEAIHHFFKTRTGRSFLSGKVIREFKFSLLNDAYLNGQKLEGEKVLLQGIVDCALIEDDGISIIDFKTDFVTLKTVPEIVAKYKGQLQTYATALERIYQLPIKGCYLYLFHLKKVVQVK